ncbi:heparanase-like protein 1 [Phragmites australis]|uniref:heparanase-like protein 1 n=1 Tax=Phragmites australis TaxID=29695 RepID=UPI002D77776B|nr:heparanase-like protein 1 [Phragmites australis]
MRLWFLLPLLCLPTLIRSEDYGDVTVIVRGSETIASTSDEFVCATIDWWPPEKCNYDQCPWGRASVLNLDLTNPLLAKAIQAFSPLRVRVGGSLQDQVLYGTPNLGSPCSPFTKISGGLFGFSQGCITMERWDAINDLFLNTGAVVTFGLNALQGRQQIRRGVWGGAWDSSNAREFMEYTVSMNYPIDSWEFGNELSGSGIGASVGAEQYGKDIVELQTIINQLYGNSTKPLVVAPGGFFDQKWFAQLLEVSGPNVLNAMTHHIYNLGAGNDPQVPNRILDPQYLSRASDTFRDLQLTIQRHGPWSAPWVGEAGGAYNSGSRLVSNTFLNSFWYLDQLGQSAKYDTKVYCRQTLIGGNYGLLDTDTFVPNPDYYSALLWHRIMGKGVLSIDISGSSYLRAYAHCGKQKGGVALLLLNLHRNMGFMVSVRNDLNVDLVGGQGIRRDNAFVHGLKRTVSWVGSKASDGLAKREEYHLTAKDGNVFTRTMLLNGDPLELTEDGSIPPLYPMQVSVNSPIYVAPLSIAFVVFPDFEAEACGQ